MTNTHACSISLLAVVAACGSAGPIKAAPAKPVPANTVAAGTYPVPELVGEQLCWMGMSEAEIKTGAQAGSRTLSRQAWDAAASTIHTDSATWTAAAAAPQRGTLDIKVDGQKGTIAGQFPGTATFVGEPGKWTSWNVELQVGGGVVAKVAYTLNPDGSLKNVTKVFDGKGKQFAETGGTWPALDAKACKDEFSKVPPK